MRVRSSSRFNRVICDAWSAGEGIGDTPGDAITRDRAVPPRTTVRQFRNIDGEMPTSVATCINGRPLLSSSATASRLNSGENSLLVFGIDHHLALTSLAKVPTESRDHQGSNGGAHSFAMTVVGMISSCQINGADMLRSNAVRCADVR